MANKIKVLYLCPNGYLGGAERFVLEANRAHLNSMVLESEILFYSDGVAVEKAREYGLKFHVLKTKFKLRQIFKLIKVCLEIRAIIQKGKYQIIHSTMPYSHVTNVLATFLLPVKRVWFQHGPVGGKLDKIASLLPVNLILFNSEYTKGQHVLHVGQKQKGEVIKIGVGFDPVSISEIDQIRREVLGEERKILLLSAGRITSWKGFETSVKALAILKQKSPSLTDQIRLAIVGDIGRENDRTYMKELSRLVKELKLEQEVIFIPHSSAIHHYYRAADVFIHSSNIAEPFGLVVAEAMLQEAFVIGSNLGGVTDILIEGETGYTFDPSDFKAPHLLAERLREVIELLTQEPAKIKSMTNRAKQLIESSYSTHRIGSQLEKLYRELLSES